jgi:hypothetical protein
MPRIDIWDVQKLKDVDLDLGFPRTLAEQFDVGVGRALGKGGFGSVQVVSSRKHGKEFACKSIAKKLAVPNAPAAKQQQHLDNIKREIAVMRKLRGTLNVVHLEAVYEDDAEVHIVMELCRGGELMHRIGRRHYSEGTVRARDRGALAHLGQRRRGGGGGGEGPRLLPGRLPLSCRPPPSSLARRSRASCARCCARWRSATRTRSCTATSSPATSCC